MSNTSISDIRYSKSGLRRLHAGLLALVVSSWVIVQPSVAIAQAAQTGPIVAQVESGPAARKAPVDRSPVADASRGSDSNQWTVGMAAGLPEGTFLPFAAEIARNLNQGGQLRVLPIVTPGATDNIRDLLYLKGVDVAITHTDVLEHFKTVEKIPNIEGRIRYIAGLYASEVHVVARPEIKNLRALEGRRVGFHTKGSGSTITAAVVFERLGIKVEPVFISNTIALEMMKSGDLAAIVHNGGKPNNLLARFNNDHGFKLLEIPLDNLDDYYVPASLTASDYPNFIKNGEHVDTIAVPALLAVYNWPASSDRSRRVARFIDMFFGRFEEFKGPGYQQQWQDINLAAKLPGWTRHWRAEEALKKMPPIAEPEQQGARRPSSRSNTTNFDAPQSARLQLLDGGGSDDKSSPFRVERPFMSMNDREQSVGK
jgi:TRAP transporter TAXI family solute receptor